jgi:cytochrome c1
MGCGSDTAVLPRQLGEDAEDVVKHDRKFFAFVSNPAADGDPSVDLTEQDQADIVAYLKLLE